MEILVIGGGPAGMLSAISAAKQGNKVILLEKMNSCGRKLLITGKGRCNITSSLPMDKFIENTPGNGKFLYSAFKNFTNKDILELLKQNGVEAKEERGNRMFPVSDKSMDVLNAFIKEMKKYNINVIEQADVRHILTKDNKVTGVRYIDKKDNAAKELLANPDFKIQDIAQRCGYTDQHYFSYCFKKYCGESPNALRRRMEAEKGSEGK